MRPLTFVKIKDGTWINPESVDYFKEYNKSNPGLTKIVMRGGDSMQVEATADQVAKILIPGGKFVDSDGSIS